MNIYNFGKLNNIFVLGNCYGGLKKHISAIKTGLYVREEDEEKPHPKELERQERKLSIQRRSIRNNNQLNTLRINYDDLPKFDGAKKNGGNATSMPFSNTIFIISGDAGLGFNDAKYYEKIFGDFNKILSYNNTYVIFIRGNHDNPSFFDGKKIDFSNLKAIPDYSVITVNGKNILCVGGAISMDRTWRKKQEERINGFSVNNKKSLYWENEAPVFDKDALLNVVESIKIDYVITHSAPSFVTPEMQAGVDEWSESDEGLLNDIKEERKVFDRIFETLRDHDMRPMYWAYGHFNNYSSLDKRSDTIFRCLKGGFSPTSIDIDIHSFKMEEENRKSKKKAKLKTKDIKFDELLFETAANNNYRVDRLMAPGLGGPALEDPDLDDYREEPLLAEDDEPVPGEVDEPRGQNIQVEHNEDNEGIQNELFEYNLNDFLNTATNVRYAIIDRDEVNDLTARVNDLVALNRENVNGGNYVQE